MTSARIQEYIKEVGIHAIATSPFSPSRAGMSMRGGGMARDPIEYRGATRPRDSASDVLVRRLVVTSIVTRLRECRPTANLTPTGGWYRANNRNQQHRILDDVPSDFAHRIDRPADEPTMK